MKKLPAPLSLQDVLDLIRPNIAQLQPYRCARDDYDSGILLDANENSFGSLVDSGLELNRYPDPHQTALCEKFAEFRGINPHQLFFGVGSDEAIDNVIRVFCEPQKHAIMTAPPTYGMYKVAAHIHNAPVQEIPLSEDFQLRVDAILDAVDEKSRILFLCNPNNPTGNAFHRDDILRLLREFRGIVVVDEAYIDFCPDKSMVSELGHFPNLIIIQTMSKAFGMAGIRLGAAMAHPEIIRMMRAVKAPYNLNSFTLKAGLDALNQTEKCQKMVAQMVAERDRLASELRKLKTVSAVFSSEANFLLIKMKNAFQIYRESAKLGVVIRYRGDQVHCSETLRITVGTREENERVLAVLKELENLF